MATLLELETAGLIIRLDAQLALNEQEWRRIYMFPHAQQRVANVLPKLLSDWNVEESPIEQLDSLAWIFCSGQPLTYSWHFKPLTHLGDGVWELKTADLRLFGWFYEKDCFICVDIDTARQVKALQMYKPYCEQAVRYRNKLDLDEPKFIGGDDPHAVVSDFSFP